MPRMPPVRTTHSFGDIATPTRIESIAKTMSVSSTFTTVAQNAVSPSHGRAGRAVRRVAASPCWKKCWYGSQSEVRPAEQLHERQLDHVDRQHRRHRPEDEGADDAVAERRLLLIAWEAEDEDRQDHRVVGAQQAFEHHEQDDGQQIRRSKRTSMPSSMTDSGSRPDRWSRGGETIVDTTRINH